MRIGGLEIAAVTFDVDGTLYNGGRALLRILPVLWENRRVLREYSRVREGLRGRSDPVDLRAHVSREVAVRLGLDPFETRVTIEQIIYGDWIHAMGPGLVFPGLREYVKMLADGGVRLGLISDYPVDEKLMKLGLVFLPWRAAVDCEEFGVLKPSTKPFIEAANRLGIEPSRILHIGDRADCDVAGAAAAGFRTALLKRGPGFRRRGNSGAPADIVFSDYKKIREMTGS
jgi:FMN phosphatase YigB (HAD superfamily)